MQLITDQTEIEKIFSSINQDDLPYWNDHPLFGELYRHSEPFTGLADPAYRPCHIAIVEDQVPIAVIAATLRKCKINHYGFPARIAFRKNLSKRGFKEALGLIIKGLKIAAGPSGAKASILGGTWGAPLSRIDREMVTRMASPFMRTHAISELSASPTQIKQNIRKSYRSLITWGKQNLRMRYVSADSPNFALFKKLPNFHRQIAGKNYYGPVFWETLWVSITQGAAELSLAYLEQDQLVGCVYVADAGETSYYSMGIFNRELFDKPLSHFPIFDAIFRARCRNMKIFDLGEIPVQIDGVNEKEVKIGFFKRGFASNFNRFTLWELEL